MQNFDKQALLDLSHSGLSNYILDGLDSLLLGSTTRLFVNTRKNSGKITPHSHRFDFECLVLEGSVCNTLYSESEIGDSYTVSSMEYLNAPGKYNTTNTGVKKYRAEDYKFKAGEWYGMKSNEVHSIEFSSDAIVLFIEGRQITSTSIYLEPFINGETIPTMKTEPWMFQPK